VRKTPTVLVVDDSKTVLIFIQRTLQQEGIRVVTAGDGLTALTRMVDDIPSLVLLDIQLPHLDGYSICQIIKKKSEFRYIPIILLGETDSIFDKMQGRLVGASEYLITPFDPVKLVEAVMKHLANWEERVPEHYGEMQKRACSWQRNVA